MRIAICDDDMIICRNLDQMLRRIDGLHISAIDQYTEPEELVSENIRRSYDLIFMDIKLKNCSGIDVSRRILEHDPCTHIVFMSGYDDYYIDVYAVDHIYFLKKPVSYEDLSAAVNRSMDRSGGELHNVLPVKNKHGVVRMPMKDILFLEKNLRRIEIHLNQSFRFTDARFDDRYSEYIYSMYGKFSDVMPKLSSAFHQCHNSYIVNYNYVMEMSGKSFLLKNGRMLPISKTFRSGVRDSFFDFVENV